MKIKPVTKIPHIRPELPRKQTAHCTCMNCGYRWQPMAMVGKIECPHCLDLSEGINEKDNFTLEPMKDTRDSRDL